MSETAETLRQQFDPVVKAFDGRACALFTFPNGKVEDPDGNRIHYIANAGRGNVMACLTEWLGGQRVDPQAWGRHEDNEERETTRMLALLAATQQLRLVLRALNANDTAALHAMRPELETMLERLP